MDPSESPDIRENRDSGRGQGIGIRGKFLLWYLTLLVIFYGTILFLFLQIRHITRVSDDIVNVRYRVSALSARLVEDMLAMEENEQKYKLLKKTEYIDRFVAAQEQFVADLVEIQCLEVLTPRNSLWEEIQRSYGSLQERESTMAVGREDLSEIRWVPEKLINQWVQQVSDARSGIQRDVERDLRGSYERGTVAFRLGLMGLAASVLVGLLGLVFLTYSINRPLRELRKGIKSVLAGGLKQPVRSGSRDELGEVARAFNEMASRLAEEERMRSDFISMLSHEIRTPLTSIRESVNLIREEITGPINDRQRRLLGIAGEEIERLTDLLRDLMQVSRLEAGMVDVNPRPTDPRAMVESCVRRLDPMTEGARARVSLHMSPHLPKIMGNEAQLQQVLVNLIGNAIKFSPPGGEVDVGVDLAPIDGHVRFTVTDHGVGIPEKEQPLVFHKYYRVSGRDQVDGMGLGLSISKHIIEAHGGAIWMESREGEGTTFVFTVPAAQGD